MLKANLPQFLLLSNISCPAFNQKFQGMLKGKKKDEKASVTTRLISYDTDTGIIRRI